jgi:hypothetical protein
VVEHSLGKGEVDSSILSGSTRFCQGYQCFINVAVAAAAAIIQVASLNLLDRISAMALLGLPRDHHDDIISDMIETVLVGHVLIDAMAGAPFRAGQASHRIDHKFGPLLLDKPAVQGGETPLIETISRRLRSELVSLVDGTAPLGARGTKCGSSA